MLYCSSGGTYDENYATDGSGFCSGSRSEMLPSRSFSTLQSCKDACSSKGDCDTLNYYASTKQCYSCPATGWSVRSSSSSVMYTKISSGTFLSLFLFFNFMKEIRSQLSLYYQTHVVIYEHRIPRRRRLVLSTSARLISLSTKHGVSMRAAKV